MDYQQLDLNILKTIINNKKYGIEFAQECSEKFFQPDLWKFSQLIVSHIKTYNDLPTLKILLDRINPAKNEAAAKYTEKIWKDIENYKYDEKEYKPDLEKFKKRYQEHLLLKLKKSLGEESSNLIKDIANLKATISAINDAENSKIYGQFSLKQGIESFVERFKARKLNPELDKGLQSGFHNLDSINNGFKAPEYMLIGGNSGAGKSTFLLSLAAGFFLNGNSIENTEYLKEGNSIIYFSLEMPLELCFDKLISLLSNVPLRAIRNANPTPEEEKRLNQALKFIKNYKSEFIIVDIPKGATASQIENIYKNYQDAGHNIQICCVDYLNIMDCDDKAVEQDWLKQTAISEDLWKFCRTNKLSLFSAVQLNEIKPEKGDNVMGAFKIGRAKSIINPTTMMILLEKRANEENYPIANLNIINNRNGPLTKFSLRKNFECCSFTNNFTSENESGNSEDISKLLEKFNP